MEETKRGIKMLAAALGRGREESEKDRESIARGEDRRVLMRFR